MDEEIFKKLVLASNFQNSVLLREEAKVLFERIFELWTGTVSEKAKQNVKSKIEIADACGRNKVFKWYLDSVSPLWKAQAVRESKNEKNWRWNGDQIELFPMRHMLIRLAQAHDIINEGDKEKLTMEVVMETLRWLGSNADRCNLAFHGVPFPSPTDPGKTVNFKTVIDTVIAAALDAERDEVLKQGWTN